MKRQRKFDDGDEHKDDERESKRNKTFLAIEAMNRQAKEREERKQSEQNNLSFLRSLTAPATSSSSSVKETENDTAWKEWRRQQEQEEKDEEKKRAASVAPAYERLFQNPRGRIFHRPARFMMNEEEKKIYQQGFARGDDSHIPFDISNLIHQYTVPEEIGTPVETCYTETKSGQSRESCTKSVLKFARALRESDDRQVFFEDVECALYCLFKNLPISVYFNTDIIYGEKKDEITLKPFAIKLVINPDNSDIHLDINIVYNKETKDYKVELSGRRTDQFYNDINIGHGSISLDDVIDLIFRYGPTSDIECRFPYDFEPDRGEIIKFNYRSFGTYPYWELVSKENEGEWIFQTLPRESKQHEE